MSLKTPDVEYHRKKNPKLRTVLITASVIGMLFIGLTVAEQIAFSVTFPKSKNFADVDECRIWIQTKVIAYTLGMSDVLRFEITLRCDEDVQFPSTINATRIWIIPGVGRIWPWREYNLFSLSFTGYSFSMPVYKLDQKINDGDSRSVKLSSTVDIIVSTNGSDNITHYLHSNDVKIPVS